MTRALSKVSLNRTWVASFGATRSFSKFLTVATLKLGMTGEVLLPPFEKAARGAALCRCDHRGNIGRLRAIANEFVFVG